MARRADVDSGCLARDDGFTLVGLMIAVMVVNIALAVAATSVVTAGRRAEEAELIWRGQQIARAIGCYNANDAGEPLESLDQLVRASCLRHLYADPVAADGQWRVLTEQDVRDGTIAELLGRLPAGSGAPGGGSDPFDRPFGEISGQGGFRSQLRSGSDAIVGVASGAKGDALRLVNGRGRYEEWVFLASGAS